MARSTHPGLVAQARYARACDRFDAALDRYLDVRARGYGRTTTLAQSALRVLQSAKLVRTVTWNAWMRETRA